MSWFNKNEYKTFLKQRLKEEKKRFKVPDKFCYKLDSRKAFWIYKTRNNIKWYREYKAKDQPNIRAKFGQRPIWDDKIAEGFIKEYPDKKFRNSIKYQNSYI